MRLGIGGDAGGSVYGTSVAFSEGAVGAGRGTNGFSMGGYGPSGGELFSMSGLPGRRGARAKEGAVCCEDLSTGSVDRCPPVAGW